MRDKWIEALRSGKYKQGKSNLCSLRNEQPEFCCIGVLADLMDIPYHEKDNRRVYSHGMVAMLHEPELQLVGLGRDEAFRLASLNDKGATFEEIAEVIENGV